MIEGNENINCRKINPFLLVYNKTSRVIGTSLALKKRQLQMLVNCLTHTSCRSESSNYCSSQKKASNHPHPHWALELGKFWRHPFKYGQNKQFGYDDMGKESNNAFNFQLSFCLIYQQLLNHGGTEGWFIETRTTIVKNRI